MRRRPTVAAARPHRRRGLASDAGLAIAFLVVIGVAAVMLRDHAAVTIAGQARVADGDTLVIAGERLRLRGLDAPELGQSCGASGAQFACGRVARDALRRHIDGDAVDCRGWDRDRYGRRLARCTVRGEDIGAWLVSEGLAVAYGSYRSEEAMARSAGRGIWAGEFDQPQAWRRQHGGMVDEAHDFWRLLPNMLRGFFRSPPADPILPVFGETADETV
jgi:endonuclease YncB( thermonuclease family)